MANPAEFLQVRVVLRFSSQTFKVPANFVCNDDTALTTGNHLSSVGPGITLWINNLILSYLNHRVKSCIYMYHKHAASGSTAPSWDDDVLRHTTVSDEREGRAVCWRAITKKRICAPRHIRSYPHTPPRAYLTRKLREAHTAVSRREATRFLGASILSGGRPPLQARVRHLRPRLHVAPRVPVL